MADWKFWECRDCGRMLACRYRPQCPNCGSVTTQIYPDLMFPVEKAGGPPEPPPNELRRESCVPFVYISVLAISLLAWTISQLFKEYLR